MMIMHGQKEKAPILMPSSLSACYWPAGRQAHKLPPNKVMLKTIDTDCCSSCFAFPHANNPFVPWVYFSKTEQ